MKYIATLILGLILSFGVSLSTNAVEIDSKTELIPESKYALEVANYSFGIESYNLVNSEFSSPCYSNIDNISTKDIFRFDSENGPTCSSSGGGICECAAGQECSADGNECECTNDNNDDDDRSTIRRILDRLF